MEPSNVDDEIEFAANPQPRCPVVLLLDTSGSMAGPPISALNAGLKTFSKELTTDTVASSRVEIAVITFDSTVRVIRDFAVGLSVPPVLTAQGSSDMGAGIERSLDVIEIRKKAYNQNGIPYYRPFVLMITDGEPTSDYGRAAARVREAEQNKRIAFFAVSAGQANMKRLSEIAVRPPKRIESLKFAELFIWLSASLKAVSQSSPGEMVGSPSTSGWEVV